jgi:hypothetical protein
MASANRSGNGRAGGSGKERLLPDFIHLADELDHLAVDFRFDFRFEVGRLRARYLGRDPQRHPDGACDAYRSFLPRLGRQPTEKGKVRTTMSFDLGVPRSVHRPGGLRGVLQDDLVSHAQSLETDRVVANALPKVSGFSRPTYEAEKAGSARIWLGRFARGPASLQPLASARLSGN